MTTQASSATTDVDRGFTLIELLVVMIIIGILAAIAIPIFLSQRQKARDSATKADVSNVGKEVAAFYVDNSATLTGTLSSTNLTIADGGTTVTTAKVSSGTVAVTSPATPIIQYQTGTNCTSATGWVITLTNPSGSQKTYYYSAQGGLTTTAPTLSATCV